MGCESPKAAFAVGRLRSHQVTVVVKSGGRLQIVWRHPSRSAKIKKPAEAGNLSMRRGEIRIRRAARVQPLVAPNVSPATKCFCIAKNIATDGNAARIDPADTRFHDVVHCPFNAATPAVIGAASSPCVRHSAQK